MIENRLTLNGERTLHTQRHIASQVKIKDKFEMKLEQSQAPQERSFKDYFSLLANSSTSCIRYLNVTTRSFELKLSVLNCLASFYGLENEDPYNHLNDFHVVCQTFKFEIVLDKDVKLRLFPFSLKDRTRSWINISLANNVTSWEVLVTKFLN